MSESAKTNGPKTSPNDHTNHLIDGDPTPSDGVKTGDDVDKDMDDVSTPFLDKEEASKEHTASDHTSVSINDKQAALVGTDKKDRGKKFGCCPCSRAVVWTIVGVMVLVYLLALGLGLSLGLLTNQSTTMAVGGVAADHTACSQVGRDMLASGGSAVDAAIATLLCCGIRQPHSMGIGGGVFLTVYSKTPHSVDTYDGREVAPMAATYDTYLNKSFLFGNLSIGVPGEIQAYWAAHQKYGHKPWASLFQPAIKMAAEGHPLSHSTARSLRILEDNFGVRLTDHPELCKMFCRENGTKKQEGDWVTMPALAKTLQGLADIGPDYLYNRKYQGARDLIKDVQAMGGLMTMDDLEKYKVVQAPPLSISLGDLTLHTLTAPSGGPVLALITRILYELNLSPKDLESSTTEGAMWHKIVESFKYVYADRLKLGDPAFVNITQLLKKMASPDYARKLKAAIDPARTYDNSHYTNITGAPWREEGTTHISVLGPNNDAVSATSSVNYYFGSLLISPSTGIILNNEMADFSTPDVLVLDKLKPSSPNFIYPGKRPLSSMAPVVIVDKDNNPRLVLGSSGGARITTVNSQVIARLLWLRQSLKDAIEAKRLHHQLFPPQLKVEPGFSQPVLDQLSQYGHELMMRKTYMAVVQAVTRDPTTGEVDAFSDPRKHAEARVMEVARSD